MASRILQLTDLHLFADPAGRLKNIPTNETLADVLHDVRSSSAGFDHVVVTGDHTHDELQATYETVRLMLSNWIDRLHLVPGNHDDRELIRRVFADRVPQQGRLTFDIELPTEGWRLIGLDSHIPGEVPGELGDEQRAWLAATLSAQPAQPTALFLHHPPVSVQSVWMDAISLRDGVQLVELIERSPQVRLVCCGHVHHEFSTTVGNATLVTTPSTGIQFNPNGIVPTFANAPPGYRIIDFNGPQFRTHVVRLSETKYQPIA